MAFFCTKSGVRIVAPGVAVSAGGDVPEFDHAKPEHADAERVARAAMGSVKDESEPSPEAKAAAANAAMTSLTNPNKPAPGHRK